MRVSGLNFQFKQLTGSTFSTEYTPLGSNSSKRNVYYINNWYYITPDAIYGQALPLIWTVGLITFSSE